MIFRAALPHAILKRCNAGAEVRQPGNHLEGGPRSSVLAMRRSGAQCLSSGAGRSSSWWPHRSSGSGFPYLSADLQGEGTRPHLHGRCASHHGQGCNVRGRRTGLHRGRALIFMTGLSFFRVPFFRSQDFLLFGWLCRTSRAVSQRRWRDAAFQARQGVSSGWS